MIDLYQRSIEIILANQFSGGAYVASPSFPSYHYCWFRDGSLVAYAMDLAGQHASAARFHAWAARAVNQRAEVIRRGLARAAAGRPLDGLDVLHTRLTLEGEDGTQQEWGNFQLDGFGTWLWALEQHRRLSGAPLPPDWLAAAGRVVDYLSALWRRPCYDCWEEFSDKVHPYTLSAIYGGLSAYLKFTAENAEGAEVLFKGSSAFSAPSAVNKTLTEIKAYIEEHFVCEGHFVKFEGQPEVDASLLGLAVPYGVVAPDDPRLLATVAEIERSLRCGAAGVHRYAADTYYGGGEWILLSAWLGWYYARSNAPDSPSRIAQILAWIESQAGSDGSLPEQVPANLNHPAYYPTWMAKWGPIASPLLWSHAKYIILKRAAQ
jgi:GH15 family glucan-1,4-alpha-glucosidase